MPTRAIALLERHRPAVGERSLVDRRDVEGAGRGEEKHHGHSHAHSHDHSSNSMSSLLVSLLLTMLYLALDIVGARHARSLALLADAAQCVAWEIGRASC